MGEDQSIFVMEPVASLSTGGETAFETLDEGEPALPAASITNGLLYNQQLLCPNLSHSILLC